MDKPEIRINFGGKGKHSDGFAYLLPSAGSSIEIDFDDAKTHYSVDCSDKNLLKVRVTGAFNISAIGNGRLLLGTGVGIDVIRSAAPFEGSMTWEIDKDWAVEVKGNKMSSGGVAGLGMRLRF